MCDGDFENVFALMKSVKLGKPARLEADVVEAIVKVLDENFICYTREKSIGVGSRIDLYIPSSGVGIEVKKGKPNAGRVATQVMRYCDSDEIDGAILVSERGLNYHIVEWNGKPVGYVSLANNWGLTV